MRLTLTFILTMITVMLLSAQVKTKAVGTLLDPSFQKGNNQLTQLTKEVVFLKDDLGLTAEQFINSQKAMLCEDPVSGLQRIDRQESKSGRIHYRYQQTWKGIPIEQQYLLLHEEHGTLKSLNGALVTGLSINQTPALSEQQALSTVLNDTVKYAWQSNDLEVDLQKSTNNATASYFPKGKLVLSPGNQAPFNYRLAWKFKVFSIEPHNHLELFVDAQTGATLHQNSLLKHTYVQGDGATTYNGNQTFTCKDHTHHYELNSPEIETREFSGSYNGFGQPFTNISTTWNGVEPALDVQWGTQKTVEFLNNTLGRDGYDDNGTKLRALVGFPFQNAFWNGYYLGYGTGDSTTVSSPTSLDIVGHEYTHAMLDKIVGFQYGGESGAIEEAYSDIFGELVEHFATGTADWKVGAEITQSNGTPDQLGLRNLADPNSHNAPSVYKGLHWHYGPTDNWGVHTNSLVYSHWFHLIAFGNGSTVTGIGIPAATELIYETLFYLQPYSDYIDLRNNSVAAANNLPTFTAAMVADVEAAWNEVGLGITAATITNVVPGQGQSLYGGFPTTISWDTNLSISTVDIQYSVNGGITWLDIALNHPYASGQLGWIIPQVPTNTALIQVTESGNPAVRGISSGYFSMHNTVNLPPVAITYNYYVKQGYFINISPWNQATDDKGVDHESVSILTPIQPSEGNAFIYADGTIRVNAHEDFVGSFSFDFRICDYGLPILCDTGTIIVNVSDTPDPKWLMNDWGVLNMNTTLSGNLLNNDYLIDPSWSFSGWDPIGLDNGSITIDPLTGDYTYSPISMGRDTIQYYATNGTVLDTAVLHVFVVEDRPLAQDSMNLIILFESTDGPGWTQIWNTSFPVSTWTGVTLGPSGVTCLDLDASPNCLQEGYGGIGLKGHMPDISLPYLERLILTRNDLSGQMPDFSGFPNLEFLAIEYNGFSGSIPDFSNLGKLKEFHAHSNPFKKNIPNFSNLPLLELLDLGGCQIGDSIPDFSNLPNLKELDLGSNQIVGSIPDFINLPALESISLDFNQLTGSIPDFSNLPNLQHIAFSINNLSGVIPDFSNLANLISMNIGFTFLEGPIPDFSNLPNLEILNVSLNRINGPIPNFSNLPNLNSLGLGSNELTGSIPDFSNLGNLIQLDLGDNPLSSKIPDLSNLPLLENLDLANCELFDTIPEFSNPNLKNISLKENKLTGSLPSILHLTSLRTFDVSFNSLTGPIFNYAPISSLNSMRIHENYFTFDGMAQNLPPTYSVYYAPQGNIPIVQNQDYLTVYPGGDTLLNTYYWENIDDGTIDIIQGTNYFQPPKEGNYRCHVENSVVTDPISSNRNLVLYSDSIYFYPVCNIQSGLDSLATLCLFDTINAGYPNMLSYTWSLNGTIVGTAEELEIINSGTYILEMQDICLNPLVVDSIQVTIDSTCIWPGDTNLDGIVNHQDLHNVGLHFGATGPARNDSIISFKPVPGTDWNQYTNDGLDLKHVDANGDGIITASDTTLILQHYSSVWKIFTPPVDSQISPIQLVPQIVSVPSGVGGEFSIEYTLENGLDSILNFYGLSFETRIQAPVDISSQVSLDSSEIQGVDEYLTLARLADTNLIQNAFTKTDLIDEVVIGTSVSLFSGGIATEKDLPTGDTLSVFEVSVENVQLRTVNSSFGTGQFNVPVQGATATVYFTEHFAFSLSTTSANCADDGAVHVNLLKGASPFTYLWSDGHTGANNTGLSTGIYEVTITDAIGNTIEGQATVEGTSAITASPIIIFPTPGLSDGSIDLNLSGGSGTYMVEWNGSIPGETISGIPEGDYTAIVMDDGYCSESFYFYFYLDGTEDQQLVSDVNIYPNPVSSDVLTIELESPQELPNSSIVMTDELGRHVMTQQEELIKGFNSIRLDVSDFSIGVYWMMILTDDKPLIMKKVIKL